MLQDYVKIYIHFQIVSESFWQISNKVGGIWNQMYTTLST